MTQGNPARQPGLVRTFLQRTLPFSELPADSLRRLAEVCTVEFVPEGTALPHSAQRPEALRVVQQGAVRLTVAQEDGSPALQDTRGEGDIIGAAALLGRSTASVHATTLEDTFFIRIPGKTFLGLASEFPAVERYFMRTLPEEYLTRAFDEMRLRCEGASGSGGLYLFSGLAGDLVHRPPETVVRGTTLQQAAYRMMKSGTGSLLVCEAAPPHGEPDAADMHLHAAVRTAALGGSPAAGPVIGIVTDKDLRNAVALGMGHEAPAETVMSAPVAAVDETCTCFDALLEMMRRQIHHLAVLRAGRVVGVITAHDIMVVQGRTPFSLFREIMQQRDLRSLHPLGPRVAHVVRAVVEEGARAAAAVRMITVFNDLFLEKVLTLLQAETGPPPAKFSWMLLGSEGRREQTFATDQDNALVLEDCPDDIIARAAQVYFDAFCTRAVAELEACGFARCAGGIMASEPGMRLSVSGWQRRFIRWIHTPEPQELLKSSIFFDFRHGHGHAPLVRHLRESVAAAAQADQVFLRHLAADALRDRPPLSFFRNLVVEKSGDHRNMLDIKRRGMLPFVNIARLMALAHGIDETSTPDRLTALEQEGHMPAQLCREAREGYEFLMHVRLVHQLGQIRRGEPAGNHISPAELTGLEKRTLKEVFAVTERLQAFTRQRFKLDVS
ncbi:putative CBS domain and cyclic nucleotide-regulated nucleotidyltransferase [Oleidesulfovibrio alaskensis G20]|uniref:Putative CBS domain and cyclic nucleotide-regulated nucleotidyltransferase n=1 Tax=Oleidesulfovibrio alaskensis (strain ATCC BAA-1058 / DSM 17464 / G20) TaxID=207559 RepID=Q315G6_OLEA2|nr:putative nucleotidyltransferase substrate binding domain-containing protein [Oleidesulfovibrio alaskensis]ABB37430.1 putative CBS domain and cyclic nucleotide-regulated nucleotidyltransferase [Oleidesulfovibrio alaskensis G20]MBG0774468.1 CBS domain-containing protein [Oleidesulfovibrio alaskensis]